MSLRRNERGIALAWLAASGLLLAVLAVWGVGLGGAERTVEALEGRWEARLDRGEELFTAGRFEQAAEHLAQLDRDHPAIFVKHRLDRQRERVLELLARSHMAADRKGRALEAAERAAKFDPRNWKNHFLMAEVAEHFEDGAAADKAYARVLEIHPSHLASVAGRITLAFEGGRYGEVPPLYEAYLDAWLPAAMTLEVGGRRALIELRVDGTPKRVEAVLSDADGAAAGVELDTAGHAVRLERLELSGAPVAGLPAAAPTAELPVDTAPWVPSSPTERLELEGEIAFPVTRARLTVTVYKPLPAELWTLVETSYDNTLDRQGLAAAKARTLIGAPQAQLQYVD